MSTPILTLIEEGMADLISGMTKGGGYYFDWGSVNELDKSKMVYPAAQIEIVNEECMDSEGGAWSDTYLQTAYYQVRVWTRLVEETSAPYWEIDKEMNMALDDLKKLFGTNYHVSDKCDLIMYKGMTREIIRTGDIFVPKSMLTQWRIQYTQGRLDPATTSE